MFTEFPQKHGDSKSQKGYWTPTTTGLKKLRSTRLTQTMQCKLMWNNNEQKAEQRFIRIHVQLRQHYLPPRQVPSLYPIPTSDSLYCSCTLLQWSCFCFLGLCSYSRLCTHVWRFGDGCVVSIFSHAWHWKLFSCPRSVKNREGEPTTTILQNQHYP